MAFEIGSVIAKIDADISGFKKGINEAKSEAKGFGSHLQSIGTSIGSFAEKAAIISAAASGAIVAFGKSSVDSFNESEKQLAQLNAVLKSTGGIAGVTAEQAIKLSKAFQKTTTYSDEATLSAENLLLTFTNITKDIFPQATETVLNMSTALGQDTKSSAIQLGKALQDPILGVTALRRVGVNFNEAQAEVIKKLVETGHAAEAQQLILKELATEFGGSAAAAANTFSGKIAILKNQFDDFKESIGAVLANLAQFAITGDQGGILKALSDLVGSGKAQQIVDFLTQLRGVFIQIGNWISDNQELVKSFLTGLAIAIGAILLVAPLIVLAMHPFILIFGAIAVAVAALYTAWETNFLGIRDIVNTVVNEVIKFFNVYLIPAVSAMVKTFIENWQYLRLQLDGILKIIIGIVQIAWAIVYGVIKLGLALLSGDWKAAWDAIVGIVLNAWTGIKNIFNGAIEFISGWGGQLFDKLTEPFRRAWDEISKIVEKIKGALDFTKRHSPSILDIVRGGVSKVNNALSDLAFGGVITAKAAGLAVGGGSSSTNTNVIQISMAGAFIADSYGANQMAEIVGDAIVKRLQNNIRI